MDMEMEREREKAVSKISNQCAVYSPSDSSTATAGSTAAATMPAWLKSTIADLTGRMKAVEANNFDEHSSDHTFAQRAESYFRKQPKLLALLKDLYNAYVALADRYIHILTRTTGSNKQQRSPRVSVLTYQDLHDQEEMESDAESSVSYQRPPMTPSQFNGDEVVAEFVIKSAERDFMVHELNIMERWCGESLQKIRLQSSLLEVLESERNVLLSQTKSLGHKVVMLEEENRELALETDLIRKQASELARCVLEMKEEEGVGRLLRTIEDLQTRVRELEKRNMEYYMILVKGGQEMGQNEDGKEGAVRGCFQLDKFKKLKLKVKVRVRGKGKGKKGRRTVNEVLDEGKDAGRQWWGKVKNLAIFKRAGLKPYSG